MLLVEVFHHQSEFITLLVEVLHHQLKGLLRYRLRYSTISQRFITLSVKVLHCQLEFITLLVEVFHHQLEVYYVIG